jgi:predicted ATPase
VDLTQFSIQKYRSITKTGKLKFGDFTVLIGPNNEGKSNILQALVTGMETLSQARVRIGPRYRPRRGDRLLGNYEWDRDFPRGLQETEPNGRSVFSFDFALNEEEVKDFETEVGSRLNGILPVSLSFGKDRVPLFAVRKQRASKALSAKRQLIADFLAKRVQVQYIPAARTADAALSIIDSMVRDVLQAAESDPAYRDAINKVRAVQQSLLDELAESVHTSLKQLLPDVRSVVIERDADRPQAGLGMRARMTVDDGTATDLEFKGDGIQSLAALSLIRHHAESRASGKHVILAVEEPEAHLHPKAVHEVRDVLRATAVRQQVVIATHSPLFVNRADFGSNILVEKTRARAATSMRELREMLGVKVSDNLAHAEVVLVVEGSEDDRAVRAVLSDRSETLASALQDGILGVQPLWGGAKLPYMLSQLQLFLCRTHVLLDDDRAGKEAAKKARDEGLLTAGDQTFARFPGAGESEFEDLVDPVLYATELQAAFNVSVADLKAVKRNKGKWSARMKLVFLARGQAWDDPIEAQVKALVSAAVVGSPGNAIEPKCETVIEALVAALEAKLGSLP